MTMDSSLPAILYLAHRVPYPPDKGDRIRTFHVLRFLAQHARVHLACLADEPFAPTSVDALLGLCQRVEFVRLGSISRRLRALASLVDGQTLSEGAFYSPKLATLVGSWACQTQYAAVLISSSALVPYVDLPELQCVPAVMDLMDLDSAKWQQYSAEGGIRAWLHRTEARRMRRLETRLSYRARAIVFVSDREANLYRQSCARGSVAVIPNGVDLEYFRMGNQSAVPSCVFVGALDYRPNVEGICWFCQEVWPELIKLYPSLKLSVVGRRPVPAVRRLGRLNGVLVRGDVPDVRPYLGQASVAVVPVEIARGVQNKVLEALAMGTPVVASRPALLGTNARPGQHLLSATSPREWVCAVRTLLEDAPLRESLQAAGRQYVEEHHRWDYCLSPFTSLLGIPEKADEFRIVTHSMPLESRTLNQKKTARAG